jgi:CRP-like cAMP-binding protein
MTNARIRQLATLELFRSCRRRELRRIDSLGTTLDLPVGRVLRRRGEMVTDCIVILEGLAEAGAEHGHARTYRPGAVLGAATVHRFPADETITATSAVTVVVFGPRELRELMRNSPQLRDRLNAPTTSRPARSAMARTSSSTSPAVPRIRTTSSRW